jgi:hypothetical protein
MGEPNPGAVALQSISDNSQVLELKPSFGPPPITIDDVLEAARVRSALREPEELTERRLPVLVPDERWPTRILFFAVAIVLLWMHFYVVRSYWAPSHPGVDQNGYQVGGKLFAEAFTTGYKPVNPYTYVGWMWVQTPDGWVYPKYPLGVPVLDAICIWLAPDWRTGMAWSYLVSPLCTVLASGAMYFMLRMMTRSFIAICGLILIATNPVALVLANNSNSHAPALAFASWGILFLMWWMRYGGWWRGLIAGLLLGYTVTIRYTEGLLILPIAAAVLTSIRYKPGRMIAWWAVAVWIVVAGTWVIARYAMHLQTERWHT